MSVAYAAVIDTNRLRELATASGASGFGVTSAEPFTSAKAKLIEHHANGMAGPLRFTYDDPETATDVSRSFPWAQSMIVVTHSYSTAKPAPTGAVVARFAATNGYEALRSITTHLAEHIRAAGRRAEALIDDNRLVDRSAAARAGVGWIGKSTMVLAPGLGPWFLIGSVVTDAPLDPTPPMVRTCGTCVACIPACPTGAITSDGLDASKCISTWLQSPGSVPRWLRPLIGRRIYGCDDCLTSCPPGKSKLEIRSSKALAFDELLSLDDESLLERFHWWYVPRRQGRYIRRNLLVAAGNSREPAALSPIRDHLEHPSSMIRAHAVWALHRMLGAESLPELDEMRQRETVAEVLEELQFALGSPGDAP